ncbi:putative transposase [Xanthomonas oryzae pv. oryzicola]|nr:putative transposase [Xanthomonas oryzae pv. oryzicola]
MDVKKRFSEAQIIGFLRAQMLQRVGLDDLSAPRVVE